MLTYTDVRDFYLPQGIRTIACYFSGDGDYAEMLDPVVPVPAEPGLSLQELRKRWIDHTHVKYHGGELPELLPGLTDLVQELEEEYCDWSWAGDEPGAGALFWDLETGEIWLSGWYTYSTTETTDNSAQLDYEADEDESSEDDEVVYVNQRPLGGTAPATDFTALLRATLEGA